MSVDSSGNLVITFRDGAGNGVYRMTYSGTGALIAAPSVGGYLTPDAPGYDVIVIAGQSNGVGWATGSSTTANSSVFALNAANTAAVAATDPLPQDRTIATSNGLPSNYTSNGKGFSIGFANGYINNGYLRTNTRVLLVQTAIGAKGFYGG